MICFNFKVLSVANKSSVLTRYSLCVIVLTIWKYLLNIGILNIYCVFVDIRYIIIVATRYPDGRNTKV